AAAACNDPDVAEQAEVAVAFAIGDERDQAAVGRPGRVGVVEVAIGELTWLRLVRGDVDDKDVAVHGFDETLAIGFVSHAGDDLDAGLLALLLGLALLASDVFDVDARGKGKTVALRRPDGRAGAAFERGDLARLAAVERQEKDLRSVVVAIRDE